MELISQHELLLILANSIDFSWLGTLSYACAFEHMFVYMSGVKGNDVCAMG